MTLRDSPLVRPRPCGRGLLCALLAAAIACGGGTPELRVSTAPAAEPRVLTFDPPDGATNVDPARTTLAVTFDRAMDPQGWAWVIENRSTAPEIGESAWDAAVRTNTAQVRLEPGRSYVVWINSPQFPYFKDPQGRAATPVRWTFTTRAVAGALMPAHVAPRAPAAATSPRVVRFEPADGAADVDPATALLRVTFDREMAEGWSWVIDAAAPFPEATGDASMSADRRQAMLPVRLRPGTTYVVWLNSAQHNDFADPEGATLPPTRWSFTTRGSAKR